ncbi:metalloregulator ArsR/SmtB family transcription factor [Agromyces sp. H3Y2-19a]|uniref:ArsR/SmtB family transcription factor n=1 Tax=Agromyces TaxID=33877 RepID=UPI001E32884D|nr:MULTISPECIES: metalloregulator ArsR/SmtB family transcription factor [Agromyces]MCD5346598.1 metalloregulator ArsR/SmtB family transcription factor [Agromyces sp. S2-1-8]MDF0512958.1 metalloregulator ArsR/SmtB family transcription factor [Agromyces chromiiresistens]
MEAYQVLDALGDPTRRRIVELLATSGPLSVGEVAAGLPVSRPAVSQHLRVLASSGLVTHDAVGTRNIYRLDDRGAEALRGWLDEFWSAALSRFAEAAERESKESS